MKIVQCTCPSCGAPLDIKSGRDYMFCEYCGEKLYIDEEATTIVFRDEARLKEAENRAREIDAAEKRQADIQKRLVDQQQKYQAAYRQWKRRVPLAIGLGVICWVILALISKYAVDMVSTYLEQTLLFIVVISPFVIACYMGYKMPINKATENRKHPKIAYGVLIFGITYIIGVFLWELLYQF